MDDNGNKIEITDETEFVLSPKGCFMLAMMNYGATKEQADHEWLQFEGFCIRSSLNRDASYAALIFDGEGGIVIGAELNSGPAAP